MNSGSLFLHRHCSSLSHFIFFFSDTLSLSLSRSLCLPSFFATRKPQRCQPSPPQNHLQPLSFFIFHLGSSTHRRRKKLDRRRWSFGRRRWSFGELRQRLTAESFDGEQDRQRDERRTVVTIDGDLWFVHQQFYCSSTGGDDREPAGGLIEMG